MYFFSWNTPKHLEFETFLAPSTGIQCFLHNMWQMCLFWGSGCCSAYSKMNFRDMSPSFSWRSRSTLSLWAAVKMFFQSPIWPVMKKQKLQLVSLHVFLSRWLQLCCIVTFTHEVSLHMCFWHELVVCFHVFLHILESRFFYNLLNGCFTQVFTQESADLGHSRLQVLQGKQTLMDFIEFVTSLPASFCSPAVGTDLTNIMSS